jgi:hypothetical protein
MESSFPRSQRAAIQPSPIYLLIIGVTIAVVVGAILFVVPTLMRGATTGSPIDRSYDQVEKARGQFLSGTTTDSSYDQVERSRIQVVLPNTTTDHNYDAVERIRSKAGS